PYLWQALQATWVKPPDPSRQVQYPAMFSGCWFVFCPEPVPSAPGPFLKSPLIATKEMSVMQAVVPAQLAWVPRDGVLTEIAGRTHHATLYVAQAHGCQVLVVEVCKTKSHVQPLLGQRLAAVREQHIHSEAWILVRNSGMWGARWHRPKVTGAVTRNSPEGTLEWLCTAESASRRSSSIRLQR